MTRRINGAIGTPNRSQRLSHGFNFPTEFDDEPMTNQQHWQISPISDTASRKGSLSNQAWISTEHPEMATAYAKARLDVASFVGPALSEKLGQRHPFRRRPI